MNAMLLKSFYNLKHLTMTKALIPICWLIVASSLLTACGEQNWNNPYAAEDADKNILYTVFTERPKHLDPVQSYSSNEIQFTAQIYEPPLQYHYLKRPFELITATAAEMPIVTFYDETGQLLSADVSADKIAYSIYEISIKPGIYYQPHPAFARSSSGDFLYHRLNQKELASIFKLSDFPQTSTRELIAEDYVYQIKRLAHPKLHSPIYELMADYIAELRNYAEELKQVVQNHPSKDTFLDLKEYPLGVCR